MLPMPLTFVNVSTLPDAHLPALSQEPGESRAQRGKVTGSCSQRGRASRKLFLVQQ